MPALTRPNNAMNPIQPEVADDITREQRRRHMRRVQLGMAAFAMCLGLVAFLGAAGNPRFKTYHTLDVIRLMTAGAGFAIALFGLIQFFVFRGSRSETKEE